MTATFSRRFALAVLALALLPAAFAAAGGAGGTGFGAQYFDPGLSSANRGLMYISGFGYGTSEDPFGHRIGGFGMAVLSDDGQTAGGVGGMLVGQEFRSGPLVAGITIFYGVGGMAFDRSGYAVMFGEADLELGVALLFAQVTAYAGYQAWGNLVPGLALRDAVVWTPVLGIRLAWGSF
jgi:hypothetical protein